MTPSPERVRIKLDFDTPNEPAGLQTPQPRRTAPAAKQRPICPYCFQPGPHTTARQCFNALER